MAERYFNADQESHMAYIFSLPRQQRCACGWFRLGECGKAECRTAAQQPAAAEDDR